MAYVITDACIKDFICAAECATAAIIPATEGDPAAAGVSQLFINPDECIDCGNCAFHMRAKCNLLHRRSAGG